MLKLVVMVKILFLMLAGFCVERCLLFVKRCGVV